MMKDSTLAVLIIAFIALALILGPLGTFWALNTISEEAKLGWYIPHAFWTYVPCWVLMILWRSAGNKK